MSNNQVFIREDLILKNILLDSSEEFSRKVIPFLDDSHFERTEHKVIFREIKKHFDQYNTFPSKDALIVDIEENERKINDEEFKNSIELAQSYFQEKPDNDIKWLEDQTEQFVKDRSLYNSLMKAIQIMDGDSTNKDIANLNENAIPELFQDALSVSFDVDIGIKYSDTFEEQYEYYNKAVNKIPCQLDWLNSVTNGGVERKTTNILLGGTGIGKTRFMVNLACEYAAMGYNVVYFTMEISKEGIRKQIDSNLMDRDINELSEIPYKNYMKMADKAKSKMAGEIYIEEFPTGFPHIGHFRYYLKELQSKEGVTPDILIVDYINLCSSSKMKRGQANSYEYIKSITEEFRGLCVEWDVAGWSPAQFNREGASSTNPTLSDISESFGMPMTVDLMIGAVTNEDLEAMDPPQLKLKQLKNRYGDLNYYNEINIGMDRARAKYFDLNSNSTSKPVQSSDDVHMPKKSKESKDNKPKRNLVV